MNNTSWLVVIGVVLAGAALFLMSGNRPAPVLVSPPSVNAGPDIVVNECSSVQLTCEAIDPNGDRLTYDWVADKGSFNDPHVLHPIYTAPAVCSPEEDVTITLTATNEHGLSASDSLIAHVCDVQSPCAPIYCPPVTVPELCPPPPPVSSCLLQPVPPYIPSSAVKSIDAGQSM